MKKHLSLPTPCSEDPSRMLEADKGLFCQKCDHVVVDFTDWQKDEILAYLRSRGAGRTCGMFLPSQLDDAGRTGLKRFLKPLRFAAITVLGLFGAKQAQAQEATPAVAPTTGSEIPKTDSIVWVIRGNVTSANGTVIAGCTVTAINAQGETVVAKTGSDGRFELHLPAGSKTEQFTLRFTANGYKVFEMENFTPSGRPVVGVTLEKTKGANKTVKYVSLGCPSF